MSAPHGMFVNWLKKEVSAVTEEGGVRQFLLMHTVDGEWRARIATFPYDADEQRYDDLAQLIWDAAEQDAETYSGRPQRYTCVCFRKEEEPYSQYSFRVTVASLRQAMLASELDSEPSNERGIVGQQLRHTEALFRLFTVGSGDFHDRLLNENRRLHEMVEKMQANAIDVYQVMDDLNERRHERELERKAEERKAAQHEKLMSMLMTFVPALLAQLMQNRMPMAEKAFRDDAFISFLGSLDENELAGAFGALSPENQAAFAELYKSARAAAASQTPQGDSNGGKKNEA
jgi:hypothetical protein